MVKREKRGENGKSDKKNTTIRLRSDYDNTGLQDMGVEETKHMATLEAGKKLDGFSA
jgi:hypothetical protein